MMLDPILEDLKPASGSTLLAFVNGLGGTPQIELYLLFNEVNKRLQSEGINDLAQPGRQLHHQPRDGRRLGHPARAR